MDCIFLICACKEIIYTVLKKNGAQQNARIYSAILKQKNRSQWEIIKTLDHVSTVVIQWVQSWCWQTSRSLACTSWQPLCQALLLYMNLLEVCTLNGKWCQSKWHCRKTTTRKYIWESDGTPSVTQHHLTDSLTDYNCWCRIEVPDIDGLCFWKCVCAASPFHPRRDLQLWQS